MSVFLKSGSHSLGSTTTPAASSGESNLQFGRFPRGWNEGRGRLGRGPSRGRRESRLGRGSGSMAHRDGLSVVCMSECHKSCPPRFPPSAAIPAVPLPGQLFPSPINMRFPRRRIMHLWARQCAKVLTFAVVIVLCKGPHLVHEWVCVCAMSPAQHTRTHTAGAYSHASTVLHSNLLLAALHDRPSSRVSRTTSAL